MIYIKIFICTYLIGSIPFAFIAGKLKGIDIREHGSGNIGATNAVRVLGKPIGITCFILDFLKGFIPVTVAGMLFSVERYPFVMFVAATSAVFGHVFTCFLKFKGGKGVATGAGALTAVAPIPVLLSMLCWGIIFKITRYVSLASIIACFICPALVFIDNYFTDKYPLPNIILICLLAFITILRHKDNIKRLLSGKENKFLKKIKT